MKGWLRYLFGFIYSAIAMVVLASTIESQPVPPLDKDSLTGILEKLAKGTSEFPPYSMDIEATWSIQSITPSESYGVQILAQFRKNGPLTDTIERHTTWKGQSEKPSTPLPVECETRSMWQGDRYYYRKTRFDTDFFAANFNLENGLTSKTKEDIRDLSGVLEGYLSEGGNCAQLLIQSGSAVIHPSMETVGDVQCVVIEGDVPAGHCTMWLEPKNEYLHRKIVVEQTFTEGRLSREIFVLDNVKISDVDGRPVVMEGTISRTWFKKEGNKSEWSSVQTIRRSNIRWNPDFAAMGAFQMDFPEGAIIHDLDDQTLEYKWRKGTLQKYVRPKCVGGNKAVPDKDR